MAIARFRLNHVEAPKTVLWRALGNALDDIDIAAQGVLVATYKRPDEIKTEGGVVIPYEVVKDDNFQSKVGLVVKLGRRAFQEDEHISWHGYKCEVGDWVVFRASDGLKMEIPGPGGVHCRLISDVHLKMKIADPDMVF